MSANRVYGAKYNPILPIKILECYYLWRANLTSGGTHMFCAAFGIATKSPAQKAQGFDVDVFGGEWLIPRAAAMLGSH